ncbi:hypothetical protein CPB84DRAFT_1758186 [Gymnopilus junonius]|uniref:Diphthine--ammonia ligase n=1 Tax=Gymnopilus junonius TaxID=109634 RepID=A0A9P5TUX6_GYMJU|nr:hypothetical protein CPB84DRAFT_1758186 [Gymnopilus junonius]
MKYLALLSGGKDSCYNLVHCAQLGHELVAAASLGPEPGKEELDSYLYQTVGQDAIELVARALGVPLYRKVISGTAVEQGSEYGGRKASEAGGVAGDETEDLYQLLVTVKTHHPDVEGVSVGAILSNYQRVRVEHVCRRLHLTALCFLWQRNQEELLTEMIDAGMEAILIKVAGIGLTTSHLGKTLAQMKPTLFKLNTLYGSHICGEGGEYESLTLDCPLYNVETEIVIHSDNDFASVAFLRVKSAELVPKTSIPYPTAFIPPILEGVFIDVKSATLVGQSNPEAEEPTTINNSPTFYHPAVNLATIRRQGHWVVVSNVQATESLHDSDVTIEEEVSECFNKLTERLAEQGLGLPQCSIINIFISSMDIFSRVNTVYSTFFGTSPPARACVGVDLPDGIRVRIEAIVFGLSYWAPANIGPYSQAILAGERVFISGQIGLIPSTLALPHPQSLAMELSLASQHVSRVTSALKANSGGGWKDHTQLAIYWLTESRDLAHVKRGHFALKDQDYPTLFLVVKELPKGALVEKQVHLHTGRFQVLEEGDDEEMIRNCVPIHSHQSLAFPDGCVLYWVSSRFREDNSSCTVIFASGDLRNLTSHLQEISSNVFPAGLSGLSMRYFFRAGLDLQAEYVLKHAFGEEGSLPMTPIPCRIISNTARDDWDFALCTISS